MDRETRAALEAEIRRRFDAGDLDGAMTAAVKGYGPELLGFLIGSIRDEDHAHDILGAACERMWRGLAAFRWDSSFRVWAYTVARHELIRAAPRRARGRAEIPVSQASSIRLALDELRTATAPFLKSEVKAQLARVRASLEPDDHTLLTLRLDRRMAWNDIARVLAGETPPANLTREAAALRKRFERLKEHLAEQLLEADEE